MSGTGATAPVVRCTSCSGQREIFPDGTDDEGRQVWAHTDTGAYWCEDGDISSDDSLEEAS